MATPVSPETVQLAAQAAAEAAPAVEAAKESVLGALGINWKLLVAQLINFSVVLFVMWKWVYTPLLKAIDARTARIDKGLKDAEAAAAARDGAEKTSEETIVAARKEAQRILEAATADAERLKQETLRQTNAQVAKVVEEGRSAMNAEKERMLADARRQVAELVVGVAGKVLEEQLTDAQRKRLLESAVEKAAV